MRCIRLRKDNIQIGDENTLLKYFRESRGNAYFVGELYVLDKNLNPNARRDYFTPSPATQQLERALKDFFYSQLYDLYHYASKVRSAIKTVSESQKREAEYARKLSNAGFIDENEKQATEREIEEDRVKVQRAEREIANRKKDTESNEIYKRVFEAIEKKHAINDNEHEQVPAQKSQEQNKGKPQYLTGTLSSYPKRERKLIARIYSIIKSVLPKDTADNLIQKIQKKLSD